MGAVRSCRATIRSSGVISLGSRTKGLASLFFGSRERISTFPGKKNFRPSVLSVALKTPYSPCMSKMRTEPASREMIPAHTSLFRIDFPVPVRPKIAKGFSTSFFMSNCTWNGSTPVIVPSAFDDDRERDLQLLGIPELELRDQALDHGCGDDLPDLHRRSLATLSRYSWNALRFRPSTWVSPSRIVRTSRPMRSAIFSTLSW